MAWAFYNTISVQKNLNCHKLKQLNPEVQSKAERIADHIVLAYVTQDKVGETETVDVL